MTTSWTPRPATSSTRRASRSTSPAGVPGSPRSSIGPYQQQVQHIEQRPPGRVDRRAPGRVPPVGGPAVRPAAVRPGACRCRERARQGDGVQRAADEALRLNPSFIRKQYLARSAGQQAQQQAVAGGQETVIEGGSGNPGPAGGERNPGAIQGATPSRAPKAASGASRSDQL
jgi:hypothetical protein